MQQLRPGQTFIARSLVLEISLELILNAVFGIHDPERFGQLNALISTLMDQFKSPFTSGLLFFPALQKDWTPWGSLRRLQQQITQLI